MIPVKYSWIQNESGPKMISEAIKLYGTLEVPGGESNSVILKWAQEIGVDIVYTSDAIPWCGLFIGVVAFRSGKEVVKSPLWAANWLNFGVPVERAMLGDVLVFKRSGGNHVGLYIGEDLNYYHVLGGNQNDRVNIMRIAKTRCIGKRRPKYRNQPPSVRVVKIDVVTQVSENEN